MKTGHWTNEEITYLQDNYVKYGSVKVAKFLNRNKRAVGCMATYLGLRRGWGNSRYRKYFVNINIFKEWTKKSAYLVGLILTDGNVTERELSIVSKDIELLEKAREAMSSEHPISPVTNQDMFRLRIGNKSMIADLKVIGITERKSKTVTLPKVPDNLFFDFLRGYLDGDGMLIHKPNKALVLKLSTGSPYILDDISKTITRLLEIDYHRPKTQTQKRRETFSTWYELTYCGLSASKICVAMYEHSDNLFLSRKYEAFTNYVNRPKNFGLRNNGNATKYHQASVG